MLASDWSSSVLSIPSKGSGHIALCHCPDHQLGTYFDINYLLLPVPFSLFWKIEFSLVLEWIHYHALCFYFKPSHTSWALALHNMCFQNFFNIWKLLGCFFESYLKLLQKNELLKQERVIFKYSKSLLSQHFLHEYRLEKSRKYYFVNFKIPKYIFGSFEHFCNFVLWTLEVDTCTYLLNILHS